MKKYLVICLLFFAIIGISFWGTNNNQAYSKCVHGGIQRSGCCSRHGGVCGCDQHSGRLRCCDGAISPSCGC